MQRTLIVIPARNAGEPGAASPLGGYRRRALDRCTLALAPWRRGGRPRGGATDNGEAIVSAIRNVGRERAVMDAGARHASGLL